MFSPRHIRRLPEWLKTETAAACLILLVVIAILGFGWQQINRSVEQEADTTAFRLAAAVTQDVERKVDQLDLTLQTVIGGRQSPANPSLSAQERDTLLSERTPRDPDIDFINILNAEWHRPCQDTAAAASHRLVKPRLFHGATRQCLGHCFHRSAFWTNARGPGLHPDQPSLAGQRR